MTIGGAKKIHRAEQVIESHRGNISAKYEHACRDGLKTNRQKTK